MSKTTLNIRIDHETLAKLREEAAKQDRSMSQLALLLIKKGLEK